MGNRLITVTELDGETKKIGYNQGAIMFLPRDRVKHFFRNHNGWAIDEEVLVRNPDLQIFSVRTTDKEDKPIHYLATRDAIIDYGIKMEHGKHGSQYCLPLKYWTAYRTE
jgi:hypothetical protein